MIYKRIYLLLTGIFVSFSALGQTAPLREIDNTLTAAFKAMVNANRKLRTDSLAPLFKKQLLEQLTDPLTLDNSLDSLSTYITIRTSADKKIKFYSWDERSGGTWRTLYCVAQFKSESGQIIVQPLTSPPAAATGSFTDSEIYEVNEVTIDHTTYYLTFARGTHGNGHHHQLIQLFTLTDDRLVNCEGCFAPQKEWVIEYPRSEQTNLIFDPHTNEISYAEFKPDNEGGFAKLTGKRITLKLQNGVFTEK